MISNAKTKTSKQKKTNPLNKYSGYNKSPNNSEEGAISGKKNKSVKPLSTKTKKLCSK